MAIFGKATVEDLDIVQSFNDQLKNSEDTMNSLKGTSEDLGASLLEVAEAHSKSQKYSEKNVDIAKSQSKAGKDILNVLNQQNKGSKLGTIMAKSKLQFNTKQQKQCTNKML